MENLIYSDSGIQILKREDEFFLRFDDGEGFVGREREVPVSREEAERASTNRVAALALLEECRKR